MKKLPARETIAQLVARVGQSGVSVYLAGDDVLELRGPERAVRYFWPEVERREQEARIVLGAQRSLAAARLIQETGGSLGEWARHIVRPGA